MLPDSHYADSVAAKCFAHDFGSFGIPEQLMLPIAAVASRNRDLTLVTSVPEASIDKYCNA